MICVRGKRDSGLRDAESVLMQQRFVVLCLLVAVPSVYKVLMPENRSASGGAWKLLLENDIVMSSSLFMLITYYSVLRDTNERD